MRTVRRNPRELRRLLAMLAATTLGSCLPLLAEVQPANPPYPDLQEMIREPLDKIPNGTVACGWDALRYRMRGNICQSNPRRLDNPRLTLYYVKT